MLTVKRPKKIAEVFRAPRRLTAARAIQRIVENFKCLPSFTHASSRRI